MANFEHRESRQAGRGRGLDVVQYSPRVLHLPHALQERGPRTAHREAAWVGCVPLEISFIRLRNCSYLYKSI